MSILFGSQTERMTPTIYTIGHSSHDLPTFFALLERFDVQHLVDIRRSPRSTRFPHFNMDRLQSECATRSSIIYSFQGETFGARRRRSPGDLNSGLIDTDDRAYADHMQRPEFGQAVHGLLERSPLVLLCSENDPEWCHRSLLADFVCLVHQLDVIHILFDGDTRRHQVHALARFDQTKSTCVYPSGSPRDD